MLTLLGIHYVSFLLRTLGGRDLYQLPHFQMRKQRHREARLSKEGEDAGLGAGQSETKAPFNHYRTLPSNGALWVLPALSSWLPYSRRASLESGAEPALSTLAWLL